MGSKDASWEFAEGDEIAPGLVAIDSLGGGYVYETWLAWHDRLFSIVVAKLIRPDQVDSERARRSLRREAETLERLAHPMLVRSFGADLEGPRPLIVLEQLEGPTLRSLLRRYGPLPLEQLMPLALNLCSVVHYLQTEGMVHLDIKPGNIVMGAPPRVIDLSLARSFDRAAALDEPVGTDAYMAPEQCDPKRLGPVGPAADVWGLGASIYEALAGQQPFPRKHDREEDDEWASPEERWPQLAEEPYPLPEGLPEGAVEPFLACLAPDPGGRPSAASLAATLEPLVASIRRRSVLGRLRPRRG